MCAHAPEEFKLLWEKAKKQCKTCKSKKAAKTTTITIVFVLFLCVRIQTNMHTCIQNDTHSHTGSPVGRNLFIFSLFIYY